MSKYIFAILVIMVFSTYGATLISDNMTNFPTGWTLSGTSGQYWTRSSSRFYSASHSAKCTPSSNYANNVNVSMERTINLSGYASAALKFYIWQRTEASYDFVQCQYYTSAWTTAWSRAGSYQSWQQISVNIPVNATKIRFRFYSDASVTYEGAYIDDVVLEAAGSTTKEWTIMVFLNGDNNLETYGIQDFNEMEAGAGSNSNRNVIVQFDRAVGYDNSNGDWTTCRRYYVLSDNSTTINSTQIQDLGEVDMGSPTTLVNFANWAIQNYPANKYLLVLWDHGDGWYKGEELESNLFRGFSNDNSSGNVIDVSNGELASALSQIKQTLGRNIDLIGWDACLMGMWEVMGITKDYANILVSSEETEGADGWYYTKFLQDLTTNPTMSALDLGKAVVNGTSGQATLDVIDLSLSQPLTVRVDTFAQQLILAKAQGYSSTIQTARNNSKQFYITSHIDLYDFADKIFSSNVPQTLKDAATNVKNAVLNAVKLYKNSSSYTMCRGVAIFHPASPSGYDTRYNNLPIASTKWDEYIKGENGVDYTVSQVTYSWITSSTATGITGDDQSNNLPLPFTFNFYGTNYNSLNICSNGFMSFTSTSTAYNPATIPNTAEPNLLVAPFWRDLNPSAGGTITYYSATDRFVVTWNGVKNYANANPQTFQVILYPNGNIVFQYNNITNDVTTSRGIENQGGTSGKTIDTPSNGTAWRFTPTAAPTQTVNQQPNGTIRGANDLLNGKDILCYPSVIKNRASFAYRINDDSKVTIKIYDSSGQVVKTVIEGSHKPGIYTIDWLLEKLAQGIYFYQFTTETENIKGKIVVINE